MSEAVELVAASLGVVLVLCTLLGLAVRFILMPYLKEHLIEPIRRTHHQVTVNHHSSDEPTVLDRIDDVKTNVDGVKTDVSDVKNQVSVLAGMFDGHMAWSESWVRQMEEDMEAVKRRKCRGWFR